MPVFYERPWNTVPSLFSRQVRAPPGGVGAPLCQVRLAPLVRDKSVGAVPDPDQQKCAIVNGFLLRERRTTTYPSPDTPLRQDPSRILISFALPSPQYHQGLVSSGLPNLTLNFAACPVEKRGQRRQQRRPGETLGLVPF